MNWMDQIVSNARTAPTVEITADESFVTVIDGQRFHLGREPDAARRAYIAVVQPMRRAA